MKWVEIAGANLTLAEGQEEYETIRVRRGLTHLMVNGILRPYPSLTAMIKPEQHDLDNLNNGGHLYLNLLGQHWQPASVETVDPAIHEPTGGTS